ncbi:tRNA (adenosine(37)-N6)-threonylcarbamoyltransferase complex ATPase subunit type 1 TsaE [Agrobacterium vitis]|uniref:tRNA (adenosine(37)-N6)-threonylcarbamoyltransferase complex ATPase subunit type 1 TsaE n=1 Tax=Agrobacterium vitis TaxID=373 RepID=UPI003D2668E3
MIASTTSLSQASVHVSLADEAATIQLGEDLALALKPGDCLALHGDLGAGKSTLARALLRALADDDDLEVPSPTFTLVQSYELRIPAAHFDLYRLGDASELDELGFDEALDTGICLVEWPERADGRLPKTTIGLHYGFPPDGGRELTITGPEDRLNRILRVLAIRTFLDVNGMARARRRFLTGDADYRAYETARIDSQPQRIVMDSPRRPATPIIRLGKTYPELVHLAEDHRAFVAIDQLLKDAGLTVPKIYASDPDGILLIEDLGQDGILDAEGQPVAERYMEAVAALAFLHGQNVSREIPVSPDHIHRIPDFDAAAMGFETELLLDWYMPFTLSRQPSDEERQAYLALWSGMFRQIHDRNSLVLRDVHSPNLLWQAGKQGIARVGLIDFQDAMIGPAAYDVASLVQDARVTIEPELQKRLLAHYLALRRAEAGFDESAFQRDFAIMAAQRNCKLVGLWVRLMKRDGKPGYMQHMPRTLAYLGGVLEHEALTPLKDWLLTHGLLPRA